MVSFHPLKKLVYISVFLIILSILVSCNVKQEESLVDADFENVINAQSPASLVDDDFTVKYDSNYIKLNEPYENIETNEKLINFRPVTENHVYEVYEYENFIVSVSPNSDNGSKILSINLTSNKIETSREIKVGDSISSVFEKYGEPDRRYSAEFNYHHEGKFITFYFNDYEKIIGIKFELI